ncbi:hypothetical protein PENTCL1PPCAC_18070, partial [Pristionchus entomophagus]
RRSRSRSVLQSSIDFILEFLHIRKRLGSIKPRVSMTAFTCIVSAWQQTKPLSIEFTKCFVILKTVILLYDIHLCIFFIAFPLFPCQGLFMNGIGVYLGMKTHATLVINLTILSAISAWYTCCLFQRYQSILPSYLPFKLQRSEMYLGYVLINLMMLINPLLLGVTIKNDEMRQLTQLANSPMSWLLSTPSFKIYTDDNSPLLAPLHFPLTVITFVLNTAISLFFSYHTNRVMKTRKDQISASTVTMNNQVVKNIQFQSNITTIGMVTPFVFWTISMFFQFVAS